MIISVSKVSLRNLKCSLIAATLYIWIRLNPWASAYQENAITIQQDLKKDFKMITQMDSMTTSTPYAKIKTLKMNAFENLRGSTTPTSNFWITQFKKSLTKERTISQMTWNWPIPRTRKRPFRRSLMKQMLLKLLRLQFTSLPWLSLVSLFKQSCLPLEICALVAWFLNSS